MRMETLPRCPCADSSDGQKGRPSPGFRFVMRALWDSPRPLPQCAGPLAPSRCVRPPRLLGVCPGRCPAPQPGAPPAWTLLDVGSRDVVRAARVRLPTRLETSVRRFRKDFVRNWNIVIIFFSGAWHYKLDAF